MIKTERKRRLAAIMFTDIVGYSQITGNDESLSLDLVEEHQTLLRKTVAQYGGQEVKSTGDGFLFEYSSVVDAVKAALEVQTLLFERNLTVPHERKLQIRIGLHLGDILDTNEDFHGNEVNVAARIEPLALPGGISITRQVADQVKGKVDLVLHSLGKQKLKNMTTLPEVYQIRMPWEIPQLSTWRQLRGFFAINRKDPSIYSLEGRLLTAQLLGVVSFITWVGFQMLSTSPQTVDRGPNRSPAGTVEVVKEGYKLPDTWEFALGRTVSGDTKWKKFPIASPLDVADELKGEYLLKLDFKSEQAFYHPTLVIGLISDTHRAYLNGKFIGGSQNFSELAKYSFDPSILTEEGKGMNTLLIKAKTRLSLTPGIYLIPNAVPFIAEFDEADKIVAQNDFSFHVLPVVYSVISLIVALGSLAYSFIRRSNLKFLYFSLFLFLGAMGLAFYNTAVIGALHFPVYRWMRLIAIGWSSFALFSVDLHGRGKRVAEGINNLMALGFAVISGIVLLGLDSVPSVFTTHYRAGFAIIAAYTFFWMGRIAYQKGGEVSKKSALSSSMGDFPVLLGFGLVLFTVSLSTVIKYSGIKTDFDTGLRTLGMVYPFAFALLVMFNGLLDYVRKSRNLDYNKKKDDLLLWISSLLDSETEDTSITLSQIQQKVMSFLQASRSSLYLFEAGSTAVGSSTGLKATYIEGSNEAKRLVVSSSFPEGGVISYSVRNRAPLWVEDITKDGRFSSYAKSRSGDSTYRTGSFIVMPLLAGKEILGVITVADRKDQMAFTHEDFCLLHLAGKGFSSLLNRERIGKGKSRMKLVA